MNIPDWILDPLSGANTEESTQLQEGLMEVTTNDEIKFKFKSGNQKFYGLSIGNLSETWAAIQKLSIAFPSSYLV